MAPRFGDEAGDDMVDAGGVLRTAPIVITLDILPGRGAVCAARLRFRWFLSRLSIKKRLDDPSDCGVNIRAADREVLRMWPGVMYAEDVSGLTLIKCRKGFPVSE